MTNWLAIGLVAQRYGRSPRQLRRWRANGYGPKPIRVYGRLLYPNDELVRYEHAVADELGVTAEEVPALLRASRKPPKEPK